MTGAFLACIGEAAAKGEIAPEVAAQAGETYAEALAAAGQTLGPVDADREAAKATLTMLEREALEDRRRTLLAGRVRRTILDAVADTAEKRGYTGIDRWWNGKGGGKPPDKGSILGGGPPKDGPLKNGGAFARFLPLLMRNKSGLAGIVGPSVEGRYLAVRGTFDARMADLIEKFQAGADANLVFKRGRALLANVVKEAFGEHTGDEAAQQLAKAWGETAETARQMFNAAGGAIPKLDSWGLPQVHDSARIFAAGKDAWIAFTQPLLDAKGMIDRDTGQPFTDRRLKFALGQMYDQVVTKGLIDRDPAGGFGKGALASQRADPRWLKFKDAASWSQYQGQFGRADAFSSMMAHLDDMAKDIGRMQVLGPNPDHQFEWLVRAAEREAMAEKLGGIGDADSRARRYINRARDMYDAFTGHANVPDNEQFAKAMATTRSYLTGVNLGGVLLTDAPSAPVFGALARTFAGLGRRADMGQFVKLLASPEARATARRMDFINETARDGLVGQTQDSLRLMTVGAKTDEGLNTFARRLPTAIMRLQGLEGMFEARKRSFRLSFMGALADAADKSLAELAAGRGDERMLATELNARGFSEADWAAIRSAEKWEPSPGATFLRPREIEAAAGQDLALRVGEMVLNAEQMAVPVSGSLWSRAALMGGSRPGTLKGEAMRSLMMYRTFVVNVSYLYGEELFLRGAAAGLTGAGLGAWMTAWAAGMVGMMTLSGGVTVQLKQLAQGKDLMPMDTPEFWGAAALQGGGFGLLGDFLYSKTARNDKTAPIAGFGPVGQIASDAWDLTGGTASDLVDAHQRPHALHHFAVRGAHDLRSYTPFANLWWAKTAFSRGVVDQLQQAIDPDAKAQFARSARQLRHDTGQGAWWPAGQVAPTRAPTLATAPPAPRQP